MLPFKVPNTDNSTSAPTSVIKMLAMVDQNCAYSALATTTKVASTNSAGITG